MVHKYVMASGGTLNAVSQGKGAERRFRFIFWAKPCPSLRTTRMTKARPTVLIIDDEPQLRRFLRAGFELAGFTVREAETAEEGLKSATLKMSDLIILDLGLPDRDRTELLDQIRSW